MAFHSSEFSTNRSVQHTLSKSVFLSGKGVHSDQPVTLSLNPAAADYGLRFVRTLADGREMEIPALYNSVGATELCTIIGDPKGTFVATIEHLVAALRAMNVDNVRIEIDGPETPVMDGSSIAFVNAIREAGLMSQTARRQYIKIEKPIRVEMGQSHAELTPYDGQKFDVTIEFEDQIIGTQSLDLDLSAETFVAQIARARTFGFMKDVEKLWAAGYALGSSLDNSVVIGDNGIMNSEGLRFEDEFVRHKMLDAIGDLALAGAPILGCYRSFRGGHKLNFLMTKALFDHQDCWSYIKISPKSGSNATFAEYPASSAVALAPSKD